MHRPRWEPSGTVAFDMALVGWLRCCTACGAAVASADIAGDVLELPGLQMAVYATACLACARHWDAHQAALVRRLETRYREG